MGKPRNKKPNRAKSIISQPLFRCRQEQPGKGKGSYRREASHNWEASCFMGYVDSLMALPVARAC